MLDFRKKRAAGSQPANLLRLLTVVKPYTGCSMMRRSATLVLFVLVALAIAVAQTPAATSNNPATTPQSQNPSSVGPTAGIDSASPPGISSDMPRGANTAVVDEVGAGTEIHAALDTPLSSKISKPGDRFTATVTDSVRADNGAVVIPSGARVEGEVAESEDGKTLAALRGKGKLSLRFRDVVLPSGQTLPLSATLISVHDTNGKNSKKADAEGRVESGTKGKDAAKSIGIGAGVSTAAGPVFGGPIKGLAIGALAGGGYVVATNGKDVNLPARAGMVMRVDQPLSWNGTSSPMQR
jgi:hypothetical protein